MSHVDNCYYNIYINHSHQLINSYVKVEQLASRQDKTAITIDWITSNIDSFKVKLMVELEFKLLNWCRSLISFVRSSFDNIQSYLIMQNFMRLKKNNLSCQQIKANEVNKNYINKQWSGFPTHFQLDYILQSSAVFRYVLISTVFISFSKFHPLLLRLLQLHIHGSPCNLKHYVKRYKPIKSFLAVLLWGMISLSVDILDHFKVSR